VNAQLFNVALDSLHSLLTIEDFKSGNSGTVRILLSDEQVNSNRHTISAVTLQKLLMHAQVKYVTLMKIDVEGYELPVLEGLDWDSPLRPRHIITEFTDYSQRAKGFGRRSLLEFMTAKGYEGFTIHGQPLLLEQSVPEDNAWFRDINQMN
jgi:Methyltransferase FkbM domain